MEYTYLGPSGLEVSNLCLGTWMFGAETDDGTIITTEPDAHDILDTAWDAGINFFDTANTYGDGDSERFLGSWLDDHNRENVIIASKCYWDTLGRPDISLSRKAVRAEIDATLNRLGTDYVDLYYIHGWHDPSPIEETLSALNDLVRAGKVHYIGVSNFAAWQLMQSQWLTDVHDWEQITVTQPRYNAIDHYPYTIDPEEQPLPGLVDACRDQNIAIASYSPLAGGFLTGKYERGPDGALHGPDGSRADLTGELGPFTDRAWQVLSTVTEVADEVDATPAQVALRWVLDLDGVTSIPIVGARSHDQLTENVEALAVDLSEEQYDRIHAAGRGDDSGGWPIYGN